MIPKKPFDDYKWRWLSVQPSEGLLRASVFLGVLRALSRFEGGPFNSYDLRNALKVVGNETASTVTLARDPDRNLFRNSGQYWRGTGLLGLDRGEIQLTPLGRRVAEGQVTQGEFAAIMVQQTTLPNPWTYSLGAIAQWRAADLEIKPLELILKVVEQLGKERSSSHAYLTNNELTDVVIPLAGEKVAPSSMASHIVDYRNGSLDISRWPDCVPDANDKRLAHEFLLFLSNFGVLRRDSEGLRDERRFYMDELFSVDESTTTVQGSIFESEDSAEQAVNDIIHSPLPSIVERQRTRTTVLARSGQALFRKRILEAYDNRCWLTRETIPEVLEAAHIVPASEGGSDEINNGLCMRIDVHRLYDSGHLRIRSSGEVKYSDSVAGSISYSTLPECVDFPPFLNLANIEWRDKYQ